MDIAALILQIALAVVLVLVAGVGLGFLISRAPRVTRVPEDYRVTRPPRATSAPEDFLVTSAPRVTSAQEAREAEPQFEIYRDAAGESRFRLKAANREIIAVGEGYKSKAGCKKGIESIKRNAPIATVVDLSRQAA